MEEQKEIYCNCENVESVHTNFDDFTQWDVCDVCGKVIELSFEPLEGFEEEID